jgi:hypothetical protein
VACDLKSGRPVTACASNPQMRFHALARHLDTGCPQVEARVLYVREDGRVHIDRHVFDAYQVDLYADELVDLGQHIQAARMIVANGGTPVVRTGAHCRYCPALPACPAYTALARTMLPDLETIAGSVQAMTPVEAGGAWLKAKTIERLLKAVLESLKARAVQEPLPTTPGKHVTEISFQRSDFDRDAALELLRAKGATATEIDALYLPSTVRQVKETNDGSKPKKGRAA